MDDTSKGNPSTMGCGGNFRNFRGEFLGCFSLSFGISNSLIVELMGAIITIEIVVTKVGIFFGWNVIHVVSRKLLQTQT